MSLTQNNSTDINDDQNEAIIDLLFIMVLFGFVTCFMVLNYRLTYMKRTNSSKEFGEDDMDNKSIVENIIYDRTDL
jgi:hypothetical protein